MNKIEKVSLKSKAIKDNRKTTSQLEKEYIPTVKRIKTSVLQSLE